MPAGFCYGSAWLLNLNGPFVAVSYTSTPIVRFIINPHCGGPQAPGLAVVLVGSRKDSETYVRNKKKACAEVGITDFGTDLPEDALEEDVLAVSRQTR